MSAPHLTNPRIPPPEGDEDHDQMAVMLAGQPYIGVDPYVMRVRDAAAIRVQDINTIRDMGKRMEAMREFLNMGNDVWISLGFFCEYVSQ
jgi:maltose O-acetyltransferase